jgi:hypothetical protein
MLTMANRDTRSQKRRFFDDYPEKRRRNSDQLDVVDRLQPGTDRED